MLKGMAIGAGGLGLYSRAGQIGHSVANGSPPLRCFFGALMSRQSAAEMGPATRYTFGRDITSVMIEICF